MAKFHVNLETGEVGQCKSLFGRCPYREQKHYDSPQEAREGYEMIMETRKSSLASLKKPSEPPAVPAPAEERLPVRSSSSRYEPQQVTPRSYAPAPSNSEDYLPPNVQEFKEKLEELSRLITVYRRYRNTGLNNKNKIPVTPFELEPFVDEEKVARAWERQDYNYVVAVLSEGYKRHYMRKKFTTDDIDYMLSDGEIEEILMRGVNYKL